MRVILIIMLFFIVCVPNLTFSQEDKEIKEIKKIIYDDLFAIYDIYDEEIMSVPDVLMIIKGNDTIKMKLNLRDSSNSRVSIIEFKHISSCLFFIEVKFKFFGPLGMWDFFSEHTFKYILYKSESRYYKINGFLVSEIFSARNFLSFGYLRDIREAQIIDFPRSFDNRKKKKTADQIQKYLYVSVLKEINKYRGNSSVYDKPFMKNSLCLGIE